MYFLPHVIKSIQARMTAEHRSYQPLTCSNRLPLTTKSGTFPTTLGLPIRIFISMVRDVVSVIQSYLFLLSNDCVFPHVVGKNARSTEWCGCSLKPTSGGPEGSRTPVLHAYLIQDKTSIET